MVLTQKQDTDQWNPIEDQDIKYTYIQTWFLMNKPEMHTRTNGKNTYSYSLSVLWTDFIFIIFYYLP